MKEYHNLEEYENKRNNIIYSDIIKPRLKLFGDIKNSDKLRHQTVELYKIGENVKQSELARSEMDRRKQTYQTFGKNHTKRYPKEGDLEIQNLQTISWSRKNRRQRHKKYKTFLQEQNLV